MPPYDTLNRLSSGGAAWIAIYIVIAYGVIMTMQVTMLSSVWQILFGAGIAVLMMLLMAYMMIRVLKTSAHPLVRVGAIALMAAAIAAAKFFAFPVSTQATAAIVTSLAVGTYFLVTELDRMGIDI